MTGLLDLVRPDLRGFIGYKSARSEGARGETWLNANESAWPNPADIDAGCRRYPEPQPRALCDALASLHGCMPEQLLVGRGSDEAIDLLVRALCVPGRDGVLVTPPVFGMYAVSARLQGVPLVEVPLSDGDAGFCVDFEATAAAALASGVKLVFLCSPLNPTGGALALDAIAALAGRLQGRALVVVDEAYGEFSATPSAVTLIAAHSNIAVLRTLSKAHALAAARIGCVVADAGLIDVLRRCQAPYPVPAPCAELALAGLSPAVLAHTGERIALVKSERARMQDALSKLPQVARVHESQANFLLVHFRDAERTFRALLAAGIVVRDQRGAPGLDDALRITIGTPAQNDRVLATIGGTEVP
jgi:histidinol-phosphate aminotransferase